NSSRLSPRRAPLWCASRQLRQQPARYRSQLQHPSERHLPFPNNPPQPVGAGAPDCPDEFLGGFFFPLGQVAAVLFYERTDRIYGACYGGALEGRPGADGFDGVEHEQTFSAEVAWVLLGVANARTVGVAAAAKAGGRPAGCGV